MEYQIKGYSKALHEYDTIHTGHISSLSGHHHLLRPFTRLLRDGKLQDRTGKPYLWIELWGDGKCLQVAT